MESLPTDHWVTSLQFTPKTCQDVYPAIDPTNPSNSLAGKVVIIACASRGIGGNVCGPPPLPCSHLYTYPLPSRSQNIERVSKLTHGPDVTPPFQGIVPSFAKAGAKGLILLARGHAGLDEAAAKARALNASVRVETVAMDISSEEAVAALFEKGGRDFGHADVLINNAVASEGGGAGALHEVPVAAWGTDMEVNFRGPLLLMRAFIAQLPGTGLKGPPSATIATLTSFSAFGIFPFMAPYSISKHTTQKQTTNKTTTYPGITSAIIHPGLVDTQQLLPAFARFDLDNPALVGGLLVWMAADPARANFLGGRMVSANWAVEGLLARIGAVLGSKALTLDLVGPFGKDQFETKS